MGACIMGRYVIAARSQRASGRRTMPPSLASRFTRLCPPGWDSSSILSSEVEP
jgi:hypothetical protein